MRPVSLRQLQVSPPSEWGIQGPAEVGAGSGVVSRPCLFAPSRTASGLGLWTEGSAGLRGAAAGCLGDCTTPEPQVPACGGRGAASELPALDVLCALQGVAGAWTSRWRCAEDPLVWAGAAGEPATLTVAPGRCGCHRRCGWLCGGGLVPLPGGSGDVPLGRVGLEGNHRLLREAHVSEPHVSSCGLAPGTAARLTCSGAGARGGVSQRSFLAACTWHRESLDGRNWQGVRL